MTAEQKALQSEVRALTDDEVRRLIARGKDWRNAGDPNLARLLAAALEALHEQAAEATALLKLIVEDDAGGNWNVLAPDFECQHGYPIFDCPGELDDRERVTEPCPDRQVAERIRGALAAGDGGEAK